MASYIPFIFHMAVSVIIIGALVLFYIIFITKKHIPTILLCTCCYTIGVIRYFQKTNTHDQFYHLYGNKTCSIKATVKDIDHINLLRNMQKCTIQLDKIRIEKNNSYWENVSGLMVIYIPMYKKIQVGDTMGIIHADITPQKNSSFNNYMLKENIRHNLFFNKKIYLFTTFSPKKSIQRWFHSQKIRLLKKLKSICSPNTFILFTALFMGYKNTNKKRLNEIIYSCQMWGIVHFFARSGLHLVILVFIWFFILSLIPISMQYKTIILISITILFWLLTFSSISFMRALLTLMYRHICLLLKIRTQVIHTLTVVTLITLIINPIQLFFLDFQLSFGLTYALSWFNTIKQPSIYSTNKNY